MVSYSLQCWQCWYQVFLVLTIINKNNALFYLCILFIEIKHDIKSVWKWKYVVYPIEIYRNTGFSQQIGCISSNPFAATVCQHNSMIQNPIIYAILNQILRSNWFTRWSRNIENFECNRRNLFKKLYEIKILSVIGQLNHWLHWFGIHFYQKQISVELHFPFSLSSNSMSKRPLMCFHVGQ